MKILCSLPKLRVFGWMFNTSPKQISFLVQIFLHSLQCLQTKIFNCTRKYNKHVPAVICSHRHQRFHICGFSGLNVTYNQSFNGTRCMGIQTQTAQNAYRCIFEIGNRFRLPFQAVFIQLPARVFVLGHT